MKLQTTVLFLFLLTQNAVAQSERELTLDECYASAKANYPLIRQQSLIQKAASYSIGSISKSFLPQLSINADNTYQSEVTSIPIKIPGIEIPVPGKDQYKIYGEVTQLVYDGGVLQQQKKLTDVVAQIEQSTLEVELYKLKERINGLFFGLLLNEEQTKLHELSKADIQNGIAKVKASLQNGTALKSGLALLQAEWLRADQQTIELKWTRRSYLDMLGLLINQNLPENTVLKKPPLPAESTEITRPELKLFLDQEKKWRVSSEILKSWNLPKASLFLQAGAGKPGLNFLSNQFNPYYIGGIRLVWGVGNLYTYKNDKANIEIEQQKNDVLKETFLFNTQYAISQQAVEKEKFSRLSNSDEEIIALRKQIKTAAAAQLENGVINSNDYLREVYAEENAAIQKAVHEIQYLSALYNENTLRGN